MVQTHFWFDDKNYCLWNHEISDILFILKVWHWNFQSIPLRETIAIPKYFHSCAKNIRMYSILLIQIYMIQNISPYHDWPLFVCYVMICSWLLIDDLWRQNFTVLGISIQQTFWGKNEPSFNIFATEDRISLYESKQYRWNDEHHDATKAGIIFFKRSYKALCQCHVHTCGKYSLLISDVSEELTVRKTIILLLNSHCHVKESHTHIQWEHNFYSNVGLQLWEILYINIAYIN